MKIGFFLDNKNLRHTDFRQPWEGSPGVGASEYLQVTLPYFIAQYGGESVETCIFAPYIDLLPSDIPCYETPSVIHATRKAKAAGVDYFVYWPHLHEETRMLDVLDDLQLASIGISQLTPHPIHVRRLAKVKALKALVCVGREQYDYLMDSPLYKKLAYIDNGVQVSSCNDSPVPPTKGPPPRRLHGRLGAAEGLPRLGSSLAEGIAALSRRPIVGHWVGQDVQ